mmetsp:Transcript_91541/g.261615  ORF Transcript_91541/g.261615 Transcript_91541/m.261615 type:complete len:109 (-) Transcript_91541:121-447(-)
MSIGDVGGAEVSQSESYHDRPSYAKKYSCLSTRAPPNAGHTPISGSKLRGRWSHSNSTGTATSCATGSTASPAGQRRRGRSGGGGGGQGHGRGRGSSGGGGGGVGGQS